jgi:hypothetical protein
MIPSILQTRKQSHVMEAIWTHHNRTYGEPYEFYLESSFCAEYEPEHELYTNIVSTVESKQLVSEQIPSSLFPPNIAQRRHFTF